MTTEQEIERIQQQSMKALMADRPLEHLCFEVMLLKIYLTDVNSVLRTILLLLQERN